MFNNDITPPPYAFAPEIYIKLFGNLSVPKALYDFVWGMADQHIPKMGQNSDLTINDVLDVGIHPCLSAEGISMAEQCLLHFAAMKMLPLTIVGQFDNRTLFTVDE